MNYMYFEGCLDRLDITLQFLPLYICHSIFICHRIFLLQISELKRINNLIRDQDFYALSSVKIPVKKHSFLIDQINKEEDLRKTSDTREKMEQNKLSNGAASLSADEDSYYDNRDTESVQDMSDPETQTLLIRKLSIGQTSRSQTREAKEFLKNMDKDLSKFTSSRQMERDSLDEVISVLTNKSVYPFVPPQKSNLRTDGTNCGLSWKSVVVLVMIICLLIPLGYLIYYLYCKTHSCRFI